MDTKICNQCGRELPIECFNYRNKSKGTRRSVCKECFTNNIKRHIAENCRIINDIKKTKPCQKCGETRIWVLDFHHLDPSEKDDTIAKLTYHSYNVERILDEIQKCTSLCANCHREFHYMERKYGITIQEYLNNDISLYN